MFGSSSIKTGDIVQLKSGGRTWTADRIDMCRVRIVSMSVNGLFQEATVNIDTLTKSIRDEFKEPRR